MKKLIDINEIREWSKDLESEKDFKIIQNSLLYNKISDVILDRKIIEKYSDEFSNNIKNENAKINDQQNSGRCWIFAITNLIRDELISKYEIEDFDLSQTYIAFYDKLEKSNFFLNKIIAEKNFNFNDRKILCFLEHPIFDGGFFDLGKNIILKYGIVPKSEMPETYHSSNTKLINQLISNQLIKALFEIRNSNNDDFLSIKEKYLFNIYQILKICYGDVPKKFSIKLKTKNKKNKVILWSDLTPQSFLKKTKFNFNDLHTFVYTPYKKIENFKTYELKDTSYVQEKNNLMFKTVNKQVFKLLALSMLCNKKSFWFSCDVDHYFEINKGIWDIKIFDYNNFFNMEFINDESWNIESRRVSSNHAMVMQGFDYDKNKWKEIKKEFFKKNKKIDINNFYDLINKIPVEKWSVENSWGDKNGNKGMYYISDNWFEKFVYEVVISKNNFKKFLKKNELFTKSEISKINIKNINEYLIDLIFEVPKKTKHYLEAWDPFNKLNRRNCE